MAQSARVVQSDTLTASVLGAAVAVGLGVAAVALTRQSAPAEYRRGNKRAALVAYLREHLAGSDSAIQVVGRLRLVHAGTQEGRLFASLYDEFREEREVVRALLAGVGASSMSAKRVAGHVSGAATSLAAGGEPGDLSLFRTLEGLAVGVQGKRCMWRALQSLLGDQPIPSVRSLGGLEQMAVRQWDAIEERRRGLVLATFPQLQLAAADVPLD